MAAIMKVSTTELERTSGEYNRIHGEVSNITEEMLSLIRNLRNIHTGEAAELYAGKALGLENDMMRLKDMIATHERALMEIAGIFNETEGKNTDEANVLPNNVI